MNASVNSARVPLPSAASTARTALYVEFVHCQPTIPSSLAISYQCSLTNHYWCTPAMIFRASEKMDLCFWSIKGCVELDFGESSSENRSSLLWTGSRWRWSFNRGVYRRFVPSFDLGCWCCIKIFCREPSSRSLFLIECRSLIHFVVRRERSLILVFYSSCHHSILLPWNSFIPVLNLNF